MKRILSSVVLVVMALLWWTYAAAGGAALQILAFLCGAGCLIGALWPLHGLALAIAGIAALSLDPSRLAEANGWNLTFLILSAAGMAHMCRRHRLLAWMAVSFPFWAMSNAVPFLIYVALGLVFMGLALAGVHPLLSGTRRTGVPAKVEAAGGARIEISDKIFFFRRGLGWLRWISWLAGFACLAGMVLWAMGWREAGAPLLVSGGMIALSFGFSLWFSTRMHFRVDRHGVHSRVLFGETTILWNEIGSLSLRYVHFPGFGANYVYYCIQSPSREILFPNTMADAVELRHIVEAACGRKWPLPDITPAP